MYLLLWFDVTVRSVTTAVHNNCLCWSQVSYRRGKEELHHYNTMPDRPDIVNATNATKLASDVSVCVCVCGI